MDGKLYAGVGDGGANHANSQSLSTLSGKLLRINPDGSIPADNPFVGTAGARGETWALGLRNPYTFAVDPVTGKIHINDVGESTWEEIDLGTRGANYGWPTCEGPSCGNNPNFTNPISTYNHSVGQAITGGAFYRANQFPGLYFGAYFFSDYLGGFIKRLDANNQAFDFWNPGNGPVDLKVGSDGALYYLSIFTGSVFKIQAVNSNQPPTASFTASPFSGTAPLAVSFNASASSDPDGDILTYAWDFGDGSPAGAGVSVSHTYQNNGTFIAKLTVSDGRGGTGNAANTITVSTLPVVAISATDPNAAEMGADTGTFTITRTGSTTSALNVAYAVSGTAMNGVDYKSLSGAATVPGGASSTTVTVTPIDDSRAEGNETVTGIAITNTSANPADVTMTLTDLDGRTAGTGTLRVPANGQTATFIAQITGLKSIAAAFQGVMQITASEAVSVMGLHARYNERGDFLMTTIPVADEAVSPAGEQIFPHLVDGGGYTTQVILHGAGSASTAGILRFMNQSGQPSPINP